jgi:hypothetical protein
VASEIESFSLVAIEAMSHAKPVIATRCGGPEDIVEDGKTGYLIPTGDSDMLAEKISFLLDSPALAMQLGRAGRVQAQSYYDIDKIARDYLGFIRELFEVSSGHEVFRRKRQLISMTSIVGQIPAKCAVNADAFAQSVSSIPTNQNVSNSEIGTVLANSLSKIKQILQEGI